MLPAQRVVAYEHRVVVLLQASRDLLSHVHRAVLKRGCTVSGCTVHFVDNEYDHGRIILQQAVPVLPEDDHERLAVRVFKAECDTLPAAINQLAALTKPQS